LSEEKERKPTEHTYDFHLIVEHSKLRECIYFPRKFTGGGWTEN